MPLSLRPGPHLSPYPDAVFASPVRQVLSVRKGLAPGLLVGAASVSAMFAATPLLIPELLTDLHVPLAAVGLVSSVQVACFALASFLGGRLLSGSRRLLTTALASLVAANLLSALAPTFPLLLATRVVAGTAAGVVNWLAWRHASRHPETMGTVASIGPATAAVASIGFGWILSLTGYPGVYVSLALVALLALGLPHSMDHLGKVGRQVSRSRSNRVLLVALGTMTLFGSSLFVYAGLYFGVDRGAPRWLLAWGLAANAVAGIIGARHRGKNGGFWFLVTAATAFVMGTSSIIWIGAVAMVLWGLFFWFAVPAVLQRIEDYSDRAGERSGDAQALMAVGRVGGPLLGGALLAMGDLDLLGIVAGSGMTLGAMLILGVESYRRRVAHTP